MLKKLSYLSLGSAVLVLACGEGEPQQSLNSDGSASGGSATATGGDGAVTGSGGSAGGSASGSTGSGGNSASNSGGSASGGAPVVAADPAIPLNERFTVIDLPLPVPIEQGSLIRTAAYPGPRVGGGAFLGWNSGAQARITRLDADLKQEGEDWVLGGDNVLAVHGLADGGAAALMIKHASSLNNSFATDTELRLLRFDAAGTVVWDTSIFGGTGIVPSAYWHAWSLVRGAVLVVTEDRFLIYAKSSNYKPIAGIHQGDYYAEVDYDGVIDEDMVHPFRVSHSNLLHLVAGPDDEGISLSVGDAGPYGLELNNHATEYIQNVWPPEEQRDAGRADTTSTVDAGDLCGFRRVGETLFATVSTAREQPFSYRFDNGDIVLLSWPVAGGEVTQNWLTNTPEVADRCPTLTPLGSEHQLIAWESTERSASMALVDNSGNIINEPVAVDAPFHRYSLAEGLEDGSVIWTYAEDGASTLQLVHVTPE